MISGTTQDMRQAGMPLAACRIIAWLQRNSTAKPAAAINNAGT